MTKTLSVYAALLLLVLSLSACQTTVKRSDSIVERAMAAWNSHDPDKTVTAYTDDVVYEDVPHRIFLTAGLNFASLSLVVSPRMAM